MCVYSFCGYPFSNDNIYDSLDIHRLFISVLLINRMNLSCLDVAGNYIFQLWVFAVMSKVISSGTFQRPVECAMDDGLWTRLLSVI